MSWNNVLPWWIYDLAYEHTIAQWSCCMDSEWIPRLSRAMPEYLRNIRDE